MREAGYSTRALGTEVDRTGRLFQSGTHHGFLWNQMLFTLRRTIYSVTLALGALGAAAVVVGFKFNSMLEQQTLAFARFTGSAEGARKEVDFLFNLAAHGPFQFQQVIQASRQLMAFGFTVQRTNFLLNNLQDAMAGMGLDQAALDRATLALGQIQSSGRLLGQDLRQLEQLGLVNPQDLARRLNIDPRQIANIGQLNIPSQTAIDAIVAYWRSRFRGAAADFQKTWVGQWSTFKDVASQTMGFVVRDLQNKIETNVIPAITNVFTVAGRGARTGGATGAFTAIDVRYGTNTLGIFRALVFLSQQLFGIWKSLATISYTAWRRLAGFGIFIKLFYLLGAALWLVNHALDYLSPVLSYLLTIWLAYRTALIVVAIAQWLETAALFAWYTAVGLAITLTNVYRYAQLSLFIVQVALTKGMALLRDQILLMTLAMETNPIILLVTAAVALVAILVILYFRWQRFHDLVDRSFHFIMSNSNPLAIAIKLAFLPIWAAVTAIQQLIKHWQRLKDIVGHGIHAAIHLPGSRFVTSVLSGGIGFPGLASGGHVVSAGGVLVGESGPELLSLPRGARVAPLDRSTARLGIAGASGQPRKIEITVPLYLNRHQIAEANAEYMLDQEALG